MYGFSPTKKDLEDDIKELKQTTNELSVALELAHARMDALTRTIAKDRAATKHDIQRVEALAKKK